MRSVHLLRVLCCTILLVVLMATGARAGYWKFTGVHGTANQSNPNGLVKADFSRNSLIYKDSSAKGELLKHLQYTWSGLPDKIYPGKKYVLTAEGKSIARTGSWYGGCSDLGIYFREAFGAGGSSVPDTTVNAETGCGPNQVKVEFTVKEGSPDKNNSFHYGHVQFSMGLVQRSAERYKYVYEWIDDDSKTPQGGVSNQKTSAEKLLFNNWNGSSCSSTTGQMEFTLPNRTFVSRIVAWSDARINRGSLNGVLNGPQGVVTISSKPGNCDPNQRQWCDRIFTISKELPAGSYSVTLDSNSVCQNSASGGLGFTQVYGHER